MSNLYLIGYRGSGKTSVAPLLAGQLGWQTLDVDQEIESVTGQSIAEIFEVDGESLFREWESTVLQAIATQSQRVVAVGGGAPMNPLNRDIMKSSGAIIWLAGSPEVLWQRIQQDPKTASMRPGLTSLDGLAEVQQLLTERTSTYEACADYTVHVDEMTPQEVADRIAQWLDTVDNQQ